MRNKANLGIHVSCLNVVVIIVSLFSSCAGETNIIDGNNNKLLSFSVSVPSWKSNDSISSSKDSRATPITETSLGASNTFNLIADENDGSSNYSTLIDNKPVSYSNNLWKTTTDYYWSGTSSKTINFYAYYSTSAINGILNHTAGSAPTLTYIVPDDAANQHDIIVATKSLTEDANSAVDLSFNHIFAAVKFSVGTSGLPSGTIASISISGINNSGTYTFGSGWTLGSTTSTFTVSPSTTITGAAGANITSDAFTMMMIPQTFSSATVTLTYSNGTAFSQTISSGTWAAGNTYTYNLSKTVIYDYDYTGSVQTFTAPYTGTYKIECWGASATVNRGAYTKGLLYIKQGVVFYIYVGPKGIHGFDNKIYSVNTTFNGGGGYTGYVDYNCTSGGGATDVRLISGTWSDFNSLKSRIIVAAGAGGAIVGGNANGGALNSFDVIANYTDETYTIADSNVSGSSQTSGYSFGIGQTSTRAGGGGGYYGGKSVQLSGAGGASFISGYSGCNAISSSSTSTSITHTGSPNHYSNNVFTNSTMIAGNASMPAPSGGTEIGHDGNGYARITFVSAN